MNKELKNLWLLVVLLSIFWFGQSVRAQSENIDVIYPEKPGPLFSEANIAPGQKITKQIIIKNNYPTPQDLGIQVLNIGDSNLASVLILEVSNPSTFFSSSLLNLAAPKETFITSVLPGGTQFNLSAYIDKTADNQYQDKKISFDIKFGFLAKEAPSIVQPPVQPPTTIFSTITAPSVKRFARALLPSPAPAIAPPSAGAVTPPAGEAKPAKEGVLGAEAKQRPSFHLPLWAWILILLDLLVLLMIWLLVNRRRKREGGE